VYEFIRCYTERVYVTDLVCRLLGVSRSAYYAYRQGKTHQLSASKSALSEQVKMSFEEHLSRYGSRRLVAELQDKGFQVGRFAVRRYLKEQGLKAIQPRSFVPKTTQTDPFLRRSDNLLLDLPPPSGCNQVFVGDITYIPLTNGRFAYLGTWMDLYSRYIVAWQLKANMDASLIFESLKTAFVKRKPPKGIIIHSDGGGQYMNIEFRKWLDRKKAKQSMTRKDNHYDNAHAESLFSRFKAELMQKGAFESIEDAQTAIFEYIEVYYNRKRRHSALGYLSPENFEKKANQTTGKN
jgi:putative transposase